MFTRNTAVISAAALGFTVGLASATESPGLGQPITEKEAAAWDLSIGPDGVGLPAGRGTVKRGEEVYLQKCQGCHGESGVGTPADKLVGGQGTLMGDQAPVKTVGSYWPYATTLFDYIRRAMPLGEPQTLSDNDVYAVSAYVLNLNGIIGSRAALDAKSLPKVKMPNRDNFYIVYPGQIK
ncbi:MAG: cytochrome c [Rhodospirillaceae bacterium]|nr:cytochrome c [Rhodospirillaceae bacterium]